MGKQSFENLGDNEIVDLARNGNTSACEFLILKYRHLVSVKASSYFMPGAENDDVFQEGMLGLLKAIRSYEPDKGAKFSTFAEICITRNILTAIETAGRSKHKPLNEYQSLNGEDGEQRTFIEEPDPLDVIVDNENVNNVMTGIELLLSDFEKQVIFLYIDGLNYKEIADQLGKTSKQVDNALQRIKSKLSRLFLDQRS